MDGRLFTGARACVFKRWVSSQACVAPWVLLCVSICAQLASHARYLPHHSKETNQLKLADCERNPLPFHSILRFCHCSGRLSHTHKSALRKWGIMALRSSDPGGIQKSLGKRLERVFKGHKQGLKGKGTRGRPCSILAKSFPVFYLYFVLALWTAVRAALVKLLHGCHWLLLTN